MINEDQDTTAEAEAEGSGYGRFLALYRGRIIPGDLLARDQLPSGIVWQKVKRKEWSKWKKGVEFELELTQNYFWTS